MSDGVQVTGLEAVVTYFDDLETNAQKRLVAAVYTQGLLLEAVVKEDKLSGQVLNVQSGRLRDSIHTELEESADRVVATVGTDVIYAAIHEYGGVIVPVTAKALHFAIGGKDIFAKSVTMPERSYLRSSLAERADEIRAALTAAVLGRD